MGYPRRGSLATCSQDKVVKLVGLCHHTSLPNITRPRRTMKRFHKKLSDTAKGACLLTSLAGPRSKAEVEMVSSLANSSQAVRVWSSTSCLRLNQCLDGRRPRGKDFLIGLARLVTEIRTRDFSKKDSRPSSLPETIASSTCRSTKPRSLVNTPSTSMTDGRNHLTPLVDSSSGIPDRPRSL